MSKVFLCSIFALIVVSSSYTYYFLSNDKSYSIRSLATYDVAVMEKTKKPLFSPGQLAYRRDSSGKNLENFYVRNVKISSSSFDNANLSGFLSIKSSFRDVSFENANLKGCSFIDSTFRQVSFKGTSLQSCFFLNVKFSNSAKDLKNRINQANSVCIGCTFE